MRRLPRVALHGVREPWQRSDEQTTITRLFDFKNRLYRPGRIRAGVVYMIRRQSDDK